MARVHAVNTVERLARRDAALRAVRGFFHDRGFVEADTHQLVPAPGTEPHIDPLSLPLKTSLTSSTTSTRYLITSPELALKRVVAAGVPRVFQLVHVFRDGERTKLHCPEFTLLEWYRGGGSLDDVADDTAGVVRAVAAVVGNASDVDVDAGVERVTVADAFAGFGVDLGSALAEMRAGDDLALPRRVRAAGIDGLADDADFDLAFFHVMGTRIEPTLGRDRLCLLSRWPAQMAVLARLDDDDRYARRFEAYARGKAGVLELCNAFDELTDAAEQRRRFVDDNALRRRLGKPAVPLDEDFLAALPSMPSPSAGNALGFDRLLMLLCGAADIDDVTPLPFR
jgi:lysyl-tRNA synthetase class 2